MIGIRQKLMLGFGGLLTVIAIVGVLTMIQIDRLGGAIETILRENYCSVVACQKMNESLERMDSGLLYTLGGKGQEGKRLIVEYAAVFREALNDEFGCAYIPNERETAQEIKVLFERYVELVPLVTETRRSLDERQADYFVRLQPLFQEIKDASRSILLMNQKVMSDADNVARRQAKTAHNSMMTAIVVSSLMALLFSYLAHRWILYPINRLIDSANEIRGGNFDLVLETGSHDEIGRLSESFNEMAAALRRVRKEDRASLVRTRRATEEVFKVIPAVIAVLDKDGRVEVSTEMADRHFGLRPGVFAGGLGYEWLHPLVRKAMDEDRIAEGDSGEGYIQQFIDNREHFFQPLAVPIPAGPGRGEPTGAALILKDVTQVIEQREMKRGVVSTVSHQLRTPLTSLRLAVHLLLEERIGPLNDKQIELLLAARDDSERLAAILSDLLDINRIESGKSRLTLRPVIPRTLVGDSVEPFLVEARDKGVSIVNDVAGDLPEVLADEGKIRHVFANLLSNALRFTGPGGSVAVRASREERRLVFSVEDTGTGIPAEEMSHLFEQFYRVPGQDEKSGVGLGLAIVKEIVAAHGGEVGVDSVVGRGSVFRFSLPFSKAAC